MDGTEQTQEDFEELPFPARRARPINLEVAEDPFGIRGQLPDTLEETAPQDEVARAVEMSRRGGGRIPKFPTVETMYAAYPDIHRTGKLRIVRTEPKWWTEAMSGQRVKVNGILAKQEAPISTDEIERRYGGYKYEVYGMLERFDRDDPGGPSKMVDVAVAEFEIPTDPVSQSRPIEENTMFPYWNRRGQSSGQQQQQQSSASSGEWGQVLQFAKEMARGNGQSTPNTAFETLARQGEMTTQQIQELARQQITALERRNERLEAALQETQARMNDRPDNIGSIIQGVAALNQSTRTSASSDELQLLRNQHDKEMARLREDHRMDLDRLGRERDREIDRIRIDADARVERAEDKQKDLRESFERREREMRDEFERRERQLRDESARQLSAQTDNYERRIDDMRQNHDREVRMLKSMQENTFQTTAAAHGVELRAAQSELAKITAELTTKQQMVDAAIAEKNRPLMDQVAEIKNMAEMLGLVTDKDDMPPAVPTAENAPLYEKLIMALMQKADTLLPQLSALAGKSATPGQPQVTPQQAQMMQSQGQSVRGLPPKPVSRMRFSDSEGPPVMQQVQSYPLQQPVAAVQQEEREHMPATSYAPMAPLPYVPPGYGVHSGVPAAYHVQNQTETPQMHRATPIASSQASASMNSNPSQVPQPSAGQFVKPDDGQGEHPAALPEVDQEPAWSKFEWIPLPVSEIQGLSATLIKACIEKIEPSALVDSFVSEHGIEVISIIPQAIDVTRFIESVRTDPATRSSILATGKGKRFLEDVWDSINNRIIEQSHKAKQQTEQKKGPESSACSSEEQALRSEQ